MTITDNQANDDNVETKLMTITEKKAHDNNGEKSS